MCKKIYKISDEDYLNLLTYGTCSPYWFKINHLTHEFIDSRLPRKVGREISVKSKTYKEIINVRIKQNYPIIYSKL